MKYGIFGSLEMKEGKRREFIEILKESIDNMPGCITYDISLDLNNQDTIWIYELWETKEYHDQSLMLPSIQKAILLGKEMIKDFGTRTEFIPFIY